MVDVTAVLRHRLAAVLAVSCICASVMMAAPAVAQGRTPSMLTDGSVSETVASTERWSDDSVSVDGVRAEPARSPVSTTGLEAAAAGVVTGRVLANSPSSAVPAAVSDGLVQFYDRFVTYRLVAEVATQPDGTFSISGLAAGSYRVAFVSYLSDGDFTPVREWHVDARSYYAGGDVVLTEGVAYSFGDVVLEERVIEASRLSGADRFETAGAVAEWYRASTSGGTIYIVNGLNFPDALSAGAATVDGALLMVEQNRIPAATQTQLTRIAPDRIVVVGGAVVVSDAVVAQLAAFVDSPDDVVRISGQTRYETSRNVITSPAGYNNTVSELLIATGRSFPDALAAVPAAMTRGGAVLLIDGSASSLDAPTRALVQSLGVPVTIVGGTGVVSAAIESELATLVSTSRVSGADRFGTSVAVAQEFFPQADWAFLANGFGFADALAAGPAAGLLYAPVYLVQRDCVPFDVFIDVFFVLANEVVTVGGTGVVSDAAADGTPCAG